MKESLPLDIVAEWENIKEISKQTIKSFPIDNNFTIESFQEDRITKYLVKVIGTPNQEMQYYTDGKGRQMLILVGGDEFGTPEEERAFMFALTEKFPDLILEVN